MATSGKIAPVIGATCGIGTGIVCQLAQARSARLGSLIDTNPLGVVGARQAFLLLSKGMPADHVTVPIQDRSKRAPNAWTLRLADELRETSQRFNAVQPGDDMTGRNLDRGESDLVEGARTGVQRALLDGGGSTGSTPPLGRMPSW